MKLTNKNADEVWNALLDFLNVEDIVIDDCGDLCTVDHDDKYHYLIQLSNGKYVSIDKISLNAYQINGYQNANWGINSELITIDEFAYHLRQKAFDVKYRILMHLLEFLKRGIMIDYNDNPSTSAFFKANSLEEIFIKNELKIKVDLKI